VLRAWRFEKQNIVNTAHKMNRPLSEHEEARLRKLYSEKIESYLDAGFGACYLRNDRIAEVVADALEFFEGDRYRLAAWCVMPNHVHVVIEPLIGFELPGILHSWKSFTSKEANKILGRRGAFWQVEAYDHLIRNEVDFDNAVKYVLANPFNAGLKNWKWVGGSEIRSLPS